MRYLLFWNISSADPGMGRRTDRISHRFEALRDILNTFHEAYTIFLSGQRIGSHIGSL